MRSMSLGGLTSRRTGALGGWFLAMLSVALSLPTVLALHHPARAEAIGILAGGTVAASLLLLLPWARLPRWLLMVWPLGLLATVAALGAVAPKGSVGSLSGITILAFFFIGQFQRRGTGPAVVPLAFAALVCCFGGWTHQLALWAPITIGVWIIVAEALARLRQQAQDLADALEGQATTDSLTGLATRHVLHERLPEARAGDAFVLIDIDHFKRINDRDGHLVGDLILSDLGLVLLAAIRDGDLAVRFGGEELLLLLAGAGRAGAESTLRRIQDSWSTLHAEVTFSAGIAVLGQDRDDVAALAAADRALYQAKQAGRDCWVVDTAR